MALFETGWISTLGLSQRHGQSRTNSHIWIRESILNVGMGRFEFFIILDSVFDI